MALSDAGSVLLITGMGGALGAVLAAAGIGDVLVGVIETIHIHPVLFAWLVAVVLKAAQGSGTLSMITAISLLRPQSGNLTYSQSLLRLQLSPAPCVYPLFNDSGFWNYYKIARLSTLGGFKTCYFNVFYYIHYQLNFNYGSQLYFLIKLEPPMHKF